MFTITHDSRTHSYQSSCPKLQCLRRANISSLTHQITNSAAHSFYASRSRRQIQFWILPVGSELVDPPEKFPNDHAYDAQSCCLAHKVPQLSEHGFQLGTVGELQSLASKLVERFPQGSSSQPAISSASAILQAADEMKVAELHDPALSAADPDNSRNLVGDRGADAAAYVSRDCRDRLRPATQVLPPWEQQRIEEDCSILTTRLDCHQIQHPIFSSKPEVNSVHHQNQRACRQAQNARAGHKPPQRLTTTVTRRLICKASARRQTLHGSCLHQNGFQKPRRVSPTLAPSFLSANAPGVLATAALPTSRTEPVDFRSATRRFRVRRIHARELATD